MNYDMRVLLAGGDLRSIGDSEQVVRMVKNQRDFDELFRYLYDERLVAMRAADAIEKITRTQSVYLQPHKAALLGMCTDVLHIESRWHLAQLLARLDYDNKELRSAVSILRTWLLDEQESKIVRVNALQSLYDLSRLYTQVGAVYDDAVHGLEQASLPASLAARLSRFDN